MKLQPTRKYLFIAFLATGISFSLSAQSSIAFLNYDTAIYKETIDYIYKTWQNNELSANHEIDTILCAFIVGFDTLNLRDVKFNEDEIKKAMHLRIQEPDSDEISSGKKVKYYRWNIRKPFRFWRKMNNNLNLIEYSRLRIEKPIYKCDCIVFDVNMERLAHFGSFDNFYVFQYYNLDAEWSQETLTLRLMTYKDQAVLIPQSKIHTIFYRWKAVIDKDGELYWYDSKNPSQNYTSEEIYKYHLDNFMGGR